MGTITSDGNKGLKPDKGVGQTYDRIRHFKARPRTRFGTTGTVVRLSQDFRSRATRCIKLQCTRLLYITPYCVKLHGNTAGGCVTPPRLSQYAALHVAWLYYTTSTQHYTTTMYSMLRHYGGHPYEHGVPCV